MVVHSWPEVIWVTNVYKLQMYCPLAPLHPFADPDDLESDLEGCAAVLLDSAAAKDLIRSLMTALELARSSPGLVLSTSKVAASEKRCALAQKLVNLCRPSVITGRITDLVALSKAITGAGRHAHIPCNVWFLLLCTQVGMTRNAGINFWQLNQPLVHFFFIQEWIAI